MNEERLAILEQLASRENLPLLLSRRFAFIPSGTNWNHRVAKLIDEWIAKAEPSDTPDNAWTILTEPAADYGETIAHWFDTFRGDTALPAQAAARPHSVGRNCRNIDRRFIITHATSLCELGTLYSISWLGYYAYPDFLLLWQFLENRPNWQSSNILWLLFAGLALTHYRVLIMTLLFIPAIFLSEYQNQGGRLLVRKIIIAGIGGAILFLPWFIHVFSGYILNIPLHHLSTPANSLSGFAAEYNSIGDIANYLSPVLWIIMLLSIAWGLWKRSCDLERDRHRGSCRSAASCPNCR